MLKNGKKRKTKEEERLTTGNAENHGLSAILDLVCHQNGFPKKDTLKAQRVVLLAHSHPRPGQEMRRGQEKQAPSQGLWITPDET